jgi:bifunctional non-homologous end joining protein LigD
VEVSNADRVVYPADGITKGEVFAYYERVSPGLLPYLSGRALTVERYPKGIGGQGFMQKNAPAHYPEMIGRHRTPREGGGTTVYPVVDTAEGILYFANLGVITFHVPPVRVVDVGHPDWVIWDLDPPPDRVDLARDAAMAMKEVVAAFGVETWPMTSGSKGYHLRTRIATTLDAEEVAVVARGIAALGAAAHPDLLTLAFLKKERGERVFIDWLRNAPYSTAVAPWSLRPRDGAPVAAPLHWAEVETIDPDAIRIEEAPSRLDADPWEDMPTIDIAPAAALVSRALEDAGIVLEPFDRFRP